MAKLIYALPLFIGTLAMTACPGDDGSPADTENGSDSTGGDDGTPTTSNPTVASVDTTADGSTTADDTDPTDPATTGPMACDPECLPGQSCINGNCIGDPETTGYMCDEWGNGNYNDCIHGEACGGNIACVSDNPANPTAGACAVLGCTDVCDCPDPADFDGGVLVCDTLTADMQNGCFFSCADGNDCPTGLVCLGGFFCGYPLNTPAEPYGDCANGNTCSEGICSVDNPDDVGMGACASPCMNPGDCPDPPAGAEAPACGNFGMAGSFCVLPCGNDNCPEGMVCGPNDLCFWPAGEVVEVGYGDCAEPLPTDGCLASETCEENAGMTHSVCTQAGCADAMDCPSAPATGDAVVACGDILGGGDTCYLDCSGGETCPDGQECVDTSYCAFPILTAVLEEDFEAGMPQDPVPAGWTAIDNDGLTVDPMLGVLFPDGWLLLNDNSGSQVAASTSWYAPAGTSDDYLITPQTSIGPNAVLTWESRCVDAGFPDGYEVRISTTGTAVADFTTVVFSVAEEEVTYQYHSVDLAAAGFADQDIYVAFRNNSNDGNLLFIDNVSIAQ